MKEMNRKRAVALRYEAARDRAPRVTAKGAGPVAEKIIELARGENIPISEDPDLVSALIQLDWYEEIPPELYRAVAEILAFAYRVNQKLKDHAVADGKHAPAG
jgi:flagellar biosynthesis protein